MSFDLGILVTMIDHATAPLKSLGNAFSETGEKAKKAGENTQAMENGLKAIEVVIGGILIEKATELTKKFLELASASQNADARLAAWVGGVKNADDVLDKLNAKVGGAGASLESMSNSIVKLRAAGLGTDNAVTTVESMVNALAAVGGGDLSAKLDAVSTAFQRFTSKGVASTRELNTILQGTGLTVNDLAKGMGKSVTEFMDDLKNKTQGAQQLVDAFNSAAQKKFGDFAELLNNTVGGALTKMKNDMGLAFSGAMREGGFAEVSAAIQVLDKWVTQLIKDFAPELVDQFFKYFRDAAPTLARVGTLILEVGEAFVTVTDWVFRMLASLPKEVTEYGIIGYILAGRTGLVLGGVAAVVDQAIIKADAWIIEAMHKAGAISDDRAKQMLANNQTSTLDMLLKQLGGGAKGTATGNDWLSQLIAKWDAMIPGVQDKLNKLASTAIKPDGVSGVPGNSALENQLAKLRTSTDNTIDKVLGDDMLLRFKNQGDQLGATMQEIDDKTANWTHSLLTAKTAVEQSKLPHQEIVVYVGMIDAIMKSIVKDTHDAKEQAEELNDYKVEQLQIETQLVQLQEIQKARELSIGIESQRSPGMAFAGGTSGFQQYDEYLTKQNQLLQQSAQYAQQIGRLQAAKTTDTAHAAWYDGQINATKELIILTDKYAKSLSAEGMAQEKFMKGLASALENDIGNGITGLIEGTMTWGDVARSVFGDLISLSVKYLLQLVEMQIFGETMQASAIAMNAPVAAALMAMYGPAAMAASIASFGAASAAGATAFETAMAASVIPFADGGVPGISDLSGRMVSGPTMFGVAGEAGTEAIMPLARVGGKLGVMAHGGSGDTYHITVQAIDTQTGLDFIGKNIASIHAGIKHRERVNLK